MNDQELDALIAAVATPRRGQVEALPLGGSAIELRELIMNTATNEASIGNDEEGRVLEHRPPTKRLRSERQTHRSRRFAIVAVAAAAASVITVGLVTLTPTTTTSPTGGGAAQSPPNSAYADELVDIAEEAPRLLVTADGWSITRANEFQGETGELEVTNSDRIVQLNWRPADQQQDYVDGFLPEEGLGAITVAGHNGSLFNYVETDPDRFAALWIDGEHSVELDGYQASEADFRALAATIEAVDVETWLDAMPASVITPSEQPAALLDVSAGIPIPPGFDQSLLASNGVTDRYELGAQVTGSVTCAWLDIWVEADASGDKAALAQAAEAMTSSKSWPILFEMDSLGDWSEVIWDFADALTADGISPSASACGRAITRHCWAADPGGNAPPGTVARPRLRARSGHPPWSL